MSRNTARQQRTHRLLEEYSDKLEGKMDEQKVEFTCENGHKQTVTYVGLDPRFIEMMLGILDGTSPSYKFPPGPESSIGKCGICGKPFKGKVVQ